MIIIYRIYQLFIALPIGLVATLLTALCTIIGCFLGGSRVWGYYPGKLWSKFLIRLFFLPVSVEGKENMEKGKSYVFVSNHQGAFDIFLIYGFLGRNFKWMMKQGIRKIPFVGAACAAAKFIFIDKSGPKKIQQSYEQARKTLKDGMSIVVFPEGSRSWDGKMGPYKRGAFMLADELQMEVVPITINGSFQVMPRYRDMKFVIWHPLRLTIHKPIAPIGQGAENLKHLSEESYKATLSGLESKFQSNK